MQLCEPRWCFTTDDEKREELSGSFAMIRLVDHAVVISLRQIRDLGLERFSLEIMAHEIGHHVYTPADLTDYARGLVRMRRGLPTKEHLAPFIANLYEDLLINDRLQRWEDLEIAAVYQQIGSRSTDRMWTFYMRIYELLWKLQRASLATGTIDGRLDTDAQLGARLIRSYGKDWLEGAGRFAALCLPYLLEDEGQTIRKILSPWHDTKSAGTGGLPEGLTEIDADEREGAIHPSEDSELSGIERTPSSTGDATSEVPSGTSSAGEAGEKRIKSYRDPFEYSEVLRATGAVIDDRTVTARYYRERALPYLVRFPSRELPESADPLPEGVDVDVGSPVEDIDWVATLLTSRVIIRGQTTRERLYGTSPSTTPSAEPIDLYLGVDCSGSMTNPAACSFVPGPCWGDNRPFGPAQRIKGNGCLIGRARSNGDDRWFHYG